MSYVKVFPSEHDFTPEQCILDAKEYLRNNNVEMMAIALKIRHDDGEISYPTVISKGSRAELSWLGRCLQFRAEEIFQSESFN